MSSLIHESWGSDACISKNNLSLGWKGLPSHRLPYFCVALILGTLSFVVQLYQRGFLSTLSWSWTLLCLLEGAPVKIQVYPDGLIPLRQKQAIQEGKNCLFSRQHWDNWIFTCKRMDWGSCLTSYTKINWMQIKDLNVRAKTLRLKENQQH